MTYADLRQLISQDLNRDDTSDIVDDYIKGRIEFYQKDFLFCSPLQQQMTLNQGQNTYLLPVQFVGLDLVRLLFGATWRVMEEVDYKTLLHLDTLQPPIQTIPTRWAPFGKYIRFWSTPNTTYTVELTGPAKSPAPVEDDDSNFWTEDAATLIRHATTAQIRLLRLRDPEGAAQDLVAAERERLKLVQETTQKESNDIVHAWW